MNRSNLRLALLSLSLLPIAVNAQQPAATGTAHTAPVGKTKVFTRAEFDQAIAANPGPVGDYKAGKVAALNFLKGQVMKLSRGTANPAVAGQILERKLKA